MENRLVEIREQQKATWNKFSSGWKKYDHFTMNFLKAIGDSMIDDLDIQESDKVLDVACGTGEPGLTIAMLASKGKVTGTDLSEKMLVIAEENATLKQIGNYETKACDVCELPFAENSFDKVSCRMGFMFFPDMQMASDRIYEVLKPGGKFSTSVWGPAEKNIWVSSIMGTINKNMQLQQPAPGSPGMFRCAAPGLIRSLLEKSGFKNVVEREVTGKVCFENFDHFWDMMNEVAAPVVGALSNASSELKLKIKNELELLTEPYKTAKGLELDFAAWVISGNK